MEELSSNDVLNCLWNKDSAEKCRIGLSDVVVYENSVPSKWYVTGKTGEISRKRNVDFKLFGPRGSKIGEQSSASSGLGGDENEYEYDVDAIEDGDDGDDISEDDVEDEEPRKRTKTTRKMSDQQRIERR
jgi:hypothetical protein